MGRWGEGLFEGDTDLDVASYISEDAAIELYNYKLDGSDEKHPMGGKGLEATRAHLNNGVLNRLFMEYSKKKDCHGMVSKELGLVFLAALAMRVGATIETEHMSLLRSMYTTIPVSAKYSLLLFDSDFRGPAKEQFEIALAHYNNTPYNFYAIRCKGRGNAKEELPEGQILKLCGRCKDVSYCGKECQAGDWKKHKKDCKTPEKRAEEERARMGGGRGFTSLNV